MTTSIGRMPAAAADSIDRAVVEKSPVRVALPALQLGLVVLLVWLFRLESRAFFHMMLVLWAGFTVHALLPLRFRLQFYVLLCLTSLGVLFGTAGLWIVALVAAFVGLAHLPTTFSLRVGILVVAGVAAGTLRAGAVPSPVPPAVWPIAASMLMLRLSVYLYDREHSTLPRNLWRTFAYFLMLPNQVFGWFPVVDYKAFERKYYDEDAQVIYQRGLLWIARGITHMLAYRYVYAVLALDPSDVRDLGDLLQHVAAAFLTYLKVTGQFHLIAGLLLLFGFNLPETNHRWLLSTSFVDLWRRANIYWKDYMQKLVYFPAYFRLRRKWGDTRALVLAMILVMFVTWLLHAYAWFWIIGTPLFTATDMAFWGLLGALVVITAARDARGGAARQAAARRRTWDFGRGVATFATCATLCVLWSLWTADSITDWLAMFGAAKVVTVGAVAALVLVAAGHITIAAYNWEQAPTLPAWARLAAWQRQAVQSGALLAGMAVLALPGVAGRLGRPTFEVMQVFRQGILNQRDLAREVRGYYENMGDAGADLLKPWEGTAPRAETIIEAGVGFRRDDFMIYGLYPSVSRTYQGKRFTTNRWGMRDQDYELAKPAGVRRIAILGPSDVMGYAVDDGEPYEAVLEASLNARGRGRYEVLNFGVQAFSPLQQALYIDETVLRFSPDLIIMTLHNQDLGLIARRVVGVLNNRFPIPVPPLAAAVEGAGLDSGATFEQVYRALRPTGDDILFWAVDRAASRAAQAGARFVLMGVTLPTERPGRNIAAIRREALARGYQYIDLTDVWDGSERKDIRVGPWDQHPNAAGYRLIATRLERELIARDSILHLGLGQGSEATTTGGGQ
ncbi:MAG: SGNH/GDSL hydrolase family protein [Gemmatimonadetes bacterium]|nr:SGNH/GDSL hydrolase family protein [Gemmatimonadota bacterium]